MKKVAAEKEYQVVLFDVNPVALEKAAIELRRHWLLK